MLPSPPPSLPLLSPLSSPPKTIHLETQPYNYLFQSTDSNDNDCDSTTNSCEKVNPTDNNYNICDDKKRKAIDLWKEAEDLCSKMEED